MSIEHGINILVNILHNIELVIASTTEDKQTLNALVVRDMYNLQLSNNRRTSAL